MSEADEQEDERGDQILKPDHLVVGRKDVLLPERQFVMASVGIVLVVYHVSVGWGFAAAATVLEV